MLPYFKIRTKPFLPSHNSINIKEEDNESIPNGKLHITIFTLSRIAKQEGTLSCTIIMGKFPCIFNRPNANICSKN